MAEQGFYDSKVDFTTLSGEKQEFRVNFTNR